MTNSPAPASAPTDAPTGRPADVTDIADRPCCPPLLGPDLDDDAAADLANTLKSLADPVRLKLINLVARSGEACACDLPAILDRTQPTISHHLSILVKSGLLEREQRGKWAWFRLNPQRLTDVCAALGVPQCGAATASDTVTGPAAD